MSRLDSDCYEQSFDDGHLRGDIDGRQSNMSKLKDFVEWLDREIDDNYSLKIWDIQAKARQLLAEEAAQEPPAPATNEAGLKDELISWQSEVANWETFYPIGTITLEKLAERNGVAIEITPPSFYVKKGEKWEMVVLIPGKGVAHPHEGETYQEAEKAARQYLMGIPDREAK